VPPSDSDEKRGWFPKRKIFLRGSDDDVAVVGCFQFKLIGTVENRDPGLSELIFEVKLTSSAATKDIGGGAATESRWFKKKEHFDCHHGEEQNDVCCFPLEWCLLG